MTIAEPTVAFEQADLPPLAELQLRAAQICQRTLQLDALPRHDEDVMELGADSLALMTMLAEMERAFKQKVDIEAFFANPTIEGICASLQSAASETSTSALNERPVAPDRAEDAGKIPPNRIPPMSDAISPEMLPLVKLTAGDIARIVDAVPGGAANIKDIYPLTPMQQGVLLHHRMSAAGDPYLKLGFFAFDTRDRLQRYLTALQAVIDRHDILRTAVFWEGLPEPVQVVWRQAPMAVEEVSIDADGGDVVQQLRERFDRRHYRLDLRRAPQMHMFIAHDAVNARWVALQHTHEISIDAATILIVQQEVHAHLSNRAGELPLPVPYRNFVAQAKLSDFEAYHKAFFHEMLADVSEPTMPFGLADVHGDGSDVAEARQPVDETLAMRLQISARGNHVSAASVFHLAWALVLARVSGRDDVVFGTVLSGRMRGGSEVVPAPGPFINMLPVRIEVGNGNVLDGLRLVNTLLSQLLLHEQASLALAQRCSALAAPTPLFTSMLNYRREATVKAQALLEGVQSLDFNERNNYPLSLCVDQVGKGFALKILGVTGIDPHRVCAYMNTALEQLVDALERAPATPLASLDVMPAAERHQLLVEWNDTSADYPRDQSIHQLFEAQAARTPEAIAVVWEGGELGYGELDARANRLAHHLMALGVGPETLVGVCLERSPALIVALLGILKAGGAYVPLDPNYPPARLAFMLADTQAPVLLTEEVLLGQLPSYEGHVLCLDRDRDAIAGGPDSDPPCRTTAENAAYVIYTSGSTGEPKGVVLTHANATAFLAWANRTFDRASMERTLFSTSICFDLSIFELFAPLVSGCTVLLVRDALELSQAPSALAPSLLNTVPSAALALLEAQALPTGLRTICLAGEPLRAELVAGLRDAAPKARIYNLYGPTECTTYATCCEVDRGARITIGRPVSNTEVYILDAQLRPAPIGVSGEIYLAGAGLTRGYLNRPGLTAEKFVADPFSTVAGMRMYRTGDLARYRPDGNIEFLGRLDDQVKIRGFRIEPGEIEAVLGDHPAVRQAVVQAREDTPGDKRLIAYVVPVDPAFGDTEPLSALLRERLPHFMRPAAFVVLDALPLTANGKIDRKALPAPDGRAYAGHYEAPVGEIETTLAEIWAAVLQLDKVGRHDSFFELGGHSLLAVSVLERMRRAGLHVDIRSFFTTPTVAALALEVSNESGEVEVPANRIPPGCESITPDMLTLVALTPQEIERIVNSVPGGATNIEDIYTLTPMQEGILFHHQMTTGGDPYVMSVALAFDTRDHVQRYVQALQAVIDRHGILRTAVLWENLSEPVQVVWRRALLAVEEVDLDPGDGDVVQQLLARFDTGHYRLDLCQAPLMRLFVAHDAANGRWLMLQLFHHLATDHTTMDVLREEVVAHLQGKTAGLPAPNPYRNFVAQTRHSDFEKNHKAFFRKMLADVSEPTMPFGLTDVHGDGSDIVDTWRQVDASLARRLTACARTLGVSAASIFHLAWALVLARVSGRDDVVFGTVLLGRMQAGEGGGRAPGLFMNTLPIRIRVDAESVKEAVWRTHQQLGQLLSHEHAPLALAQQCSALPASTPLFSSLLNYRHDVSAKARLSWEGMQWLSFKGRTSYPLSLSVDQMHAGFAFIVQVVAGIDPQRVGSYMHTALEQLIDALENVPATPLASLDVMPAAERHQLLVEWNDTAVDYPRECAHELFEAQAARTPEAVAVVCEDRQLTYAELNACANRLAHRLVALGVGREVLVGLCVERSLEMVIGLLGILKAGGAYVPIDPKWPTDRVRLVVEDARLAAVVTQPIHVDRLPSVVPRVFCDLHAESSEAQTENNPELPVSPADPAYVLYTSGTTSLPKGVLIEHRQLVQYVWAAADRLDLEPYANYAMLQPLTVDSCHTMIFPAIGRGGALHLISQERALDARKLIAYFGQHHIDYLKIAPSHLAALLDQLPSVALLPSRALIIGGEASHWDFIDRLWSLAPRCEIWNHYGPTETIVGVSVCRLDSVGLRISKTVPIGRPLANVRFYVVDQNLQPVPPGMSGELCIGGEQLARGYLNRPDLTAAKFVPDPFSGIAGARLYRTGDLVRYLPDGNIEFLGRLDDQVKIRGFRIEPGEVEAVLASHPAVRHAVVQAREDTPGDKRLVAYVVPADPAFGDTESLRALARQRLPDHMRPAAYVLLERLPLSAHGKVDRKALPAPDAQAYASSGYDAPVGEIETGLAAIWAQVLKLEKVGRHDNFFELGGHSLLVVSVIERMRRAGLHVDIRTFFASPTVAALAMEAGTESGEVDVPANRIPPGCEKITPDMLSLAALTPEEIEGVVATVPGGAGNVQDIYGLAPLQEGILFHHMLAREGDPYQAQMLFSFDSRERLDDYVRALQAVVDRHDVLRTAVLWEGLSEPVQVVWRQARLVVEEADFDATAGDVAQQLSARFDSRHFRFDLGQAPLLRLFIAHDAANGRWLMLQLHHHLAIDQTTLEIMQEEILAHLQGRGGELPAPVAYRNFLAQARLGTSREEHEAFFKDMLGDVDEPTTPFGLTDVRGDGSDMADAWQWLDLSLARRLRERARALGVTTASLFHLAWAEVLARVSGRDDVVFGTVLFGRVQAGEGGDRAPGLFMNTLPIRIRVDGESVQEAVRRTHMQLAQLLGHEHAPLAVAQRCSALPAQTPLFSALLNCRRITEGGGLPFKGSKAAQSWPGIEILRLSNRTNYPLLMSVNDFGEAFALDIQVRSPVDPQRVCAYMQTALEQLVDALENAPATPLASLEVMPAAERQQLLVEWNDTAADYPREQSIHQLFEAQAARTPEAVAVVFESGELTYGELNARANRLAHHLMALGVGPETLVGVCMERSPMLIVGLLGILKAGGAYVPLDPNYPPARLAFMLADTQAPVLLTQEALVGQLSSYEGRILCLDRDWDAIAGEPDSNPPCRTAAENLAYVIFTSGSTGKPKGVQVEHRSVVNLLNAMQSAPGIGEDDVLLAVTTLSFDIAALEIFTPLIVGARIVIASCDDTVDGARLHDLIGRHTVTILQATPATWQLLLEGGWEGSPTLTAMCGGEELNAELAGKLVKRCKALWNMYGPTETTIWSSIAPIREVGDFIPLGHPIDNTAIYVLDLAGKPAPIGVAGELAIGGVGVARGYLNRPDLTAEKFVPDPFSTVPGARLYRTGDLARYRADGNIEFLGRLDDQVKIRGFRIELGEIEAVLASHPAVRQALVRARQDTLGDKRLVAYVVPTDPALSGPEQLRGLLRERLPSYMHPTAYVALDELPLTANGKIDYKALPAPDGSAYASGYEEPVGEIETGLAAIWAQVLKLEKVGRHDNFFELGGHSLLATQVISRARDKFDLHIELEGIFLAGTVRELAEYINVLYSMKKAEMKETSKITFERIRI